MFNKVTAWLCSIVMLGVGCGTPGKSVDRDIEYLGILENQNGSSYVRPSFIFQEGSWRAISVHDKSNLPKSWRVYHAGHDLGTVSVNLDDRSSNGSDLQKIGQNLKPDFAIAENKEKFQNWRGVPKYRPLLATYGKGVTSSPQMERNELKASAKRKILSEFRKLGSTIVLCDRVLSDKIINREHKYTDRDLNVLDAIVLDNDSILVSVRLDQNLQLCDGPPEDIWSPHWFLFKNESDIKFVGRNMYLVDGLTSNVFNAVWVFSTSAYNQDGYIIFFDSFTKSVGIDWKYH